jgi:hypothetical protein
VVRPQAKSFFRGKLPLATNTYRKRGTCPAHRRRWLPARLEFAMIATDFVHQQPPSLAAALDEALSIRRRCQTPRGRVCEELEIVARIQDAAVASPRAWRRAVHQRGSELALWLWGVALGVAALGLADQALGLLDALPGVNAGGSGRRALLEELIALAQTEQPSLARVG